MNKRELGRRAPTAGELKRLRSVIDELQKHLHEVEMRADQFGIKELEKLVMRAWPLVNTAYGVMNREVNKKEKGDE